MTIPYYKELESKKRSISITKEAERNNGYVKLLRKGKIMDQLISVSDNIMLDRYGAAYILPNGMLYELVSDHKLAPITDLFGEELFLSLEPIDDREILEQKRSRLLLFDNKYDITIYKNLPQRLLEIKEYLKERGSYNDYGLLYGCYDKIFVPQYINYTNYKHARYTPKIDSNNKVDINRYCGYFNAVPIKIPGLLYYDKSGQLKSYSGEYGYFSKDVERIVLSFEVAKELIYDYCVYVKNNSKDLRELLIDYFGEIELKTRYYYDIDFSLKNIDVLVCAMGFDKVETQRIKTITTSHLNINERFYNYLLMEYDIKQVPKLVLNKEKNKFEWLNMNNNLVENTSKEREFEEEIKVIKKSIPINERYRFFR